MILPLKSDDVRLPILDGEVHAFQMKKRTHIHASGSDCTERKWPGKHHLVDSSATQIDDEEPTSEKKKSAR